MILLTVSCAKEEIVLPVEEELADALKGAKVLDVEDLILDGSTHFPSYAVKEHKEISPDWNSFTCTAELTIEGHEMTLKTWEYFGILLMREVEFAGEITPSGKVKFSWPDTWIEHMYDPTTGDHLGEIEMNIDGLDDQIRMHTGCLVYGPGKGKGVFRLHYKGTFDGDNFYAETHFMGKQEDWGLVPFYAPYDETENPVGLEAIVKGPIKFTFTIELSVPQ